MKRRPIFDSRAKPSWLFSPAKERQVREDPVEPVGCWHTTLGHTLSAAIFELLSNPATLEKVKAELTAAIQDPNEIISFAELDGLVYFNAIIQETIRLHPGVVSRQWRESPEPLIYKDERKGVKYVIPPDVGYSMSPIILHHDPSVFENPREFQPQRWIDNPKLSRAFMGFSRGPRSCIG
jgi:cytochrome P450